MDRVCIADAGLETPRDILREPFQQHRCRKAIEALYAAPLTKCDSTLLATTPDLAFAFSLAIECLPTLSDRLTACAVFAQLCYAELGDGSEQGALGGPVHPDPHPYCSKFAVKGDLLIVYATVKEAVEVRSTEFAKFS